MKRILTTLFFMPLICKAQKNLLTNKGDIVTSTTTGNNILTLPNPSAVRFLRINADNTITARTAAELLADIGAPAAASLATIATSGSAADLTSGAIPATRFGSGTIPLVALDAGGSRSGLTFLCGNNSFRLLDGTDIPNNAANTTGSAATLTTGRTFSLTGDGTGTSAAFNGSANASIPITLATVNSNVGTFGNATTVPIVTVNAKGLVTGVTTATISGGGGGEANTSSNVNTSGVGVFKQKTGVNLEFRGINPASSMMSTTLNAGTNAVDIDVVPANFTGIPQSGVTGLSTSLSGKQDNLTGTGFVKSTAGVISYDNSTYVGANNTTLTGLTKINNYALGVLIITASGTTNNLTVASPNIIEINGTNSESFNLPNATTLQVGTQYHISNNASFSVTVNYNSTTLFHTVASGTDAWYELLDNTTTDGTWDINYLGNKVLTGKSLTVNNTLTLAGIDNTTITFPAGGGNVWTNSSNNSTTDALNGQKTFVAGTLITGANTTTNPSIKMTPGGSLMTTPASGNIEMDGQGHLFGSSNSGRGIIPENQYMIQNAAYTLTAVTTLQKLFNVTTNGAFNAQASTAYEFECDFSLTAISATSGTVAFGFGGTATYTNVTMDMIYDRAASVNTATASLLSSVSTTTPGTAGTANMPTTAAGTTVQGNFKVKGIIRVSAAGTIIPSVQLSVANAAVVGNGSSFRIRPLGASTVTVIGNFN
jgi:hypothetical protein